MSQVQERWRRKIIYNMSIYMHLSCNRHDMRTNVEQADFIHNLRHSYASRALALGEGLTMIGKLLGHTQVQTTARYAHLARDSIQNAAARITGSIGGNLSPAQGVEEAAKR